MRKLGELLKEYSVGLKFFRPNEEDDAAFLYAVREYLEERRDKLTTEEVQQLTDADSLAFELWKKYKHSQGEGLFYLELLVRKFVLKPAHTV